MNSFDIIPVVTIPHTGTHTVIKTIDPEGSEILQTFCENNPKATKEILDHEVRSKGLKYGYALLEPLAKENNIDNSIFLYKDRSNIVYGHPAPYYRAGKDVNYTQSIEMIKVLSDYNRIIMPMRDPLLSLISSEIRLDKREEKAEISKPISSIGKVLENICWETPMDKFRRTHPRAQIKKIVRKRLPERLPGAKAPIFGSDNTKPSDNLSPSQLFMWKLWAEEIDKLNPFYVFMDLKESNSKYQDIDFTHMGNHNYAGDHPLRQAYNNRDLHFIAAYLKDNLRALMNMESTLRPSLEKLGYKDLLWWSK